LIRAQNSDTTAQPVKRPHIAKRYINQAYRIGALRAQNNFASIYITHHTLVGKQCSPVELHNTDIR
jgi:hypothetical protein